MDDELEKKKPSIQADNQSIAIGEINIRGTVTGNITIGSPAEPAMDARLRHDLGILLKNVETTWIKGVLEKSVHEAALLELGLELREEAIDNPWRMVMEAPDQSRETLPQGRRIKDIFDEANRLLLILGEPGSGKTTTLLQLARDLIAEVDSAFTQPVPVILNLSTWTIKQQPLDEWLVAELNSKYRLPKKDGQRWLKERRILPLLDGLDEVRAENRAACVEKINQLVVDYGLQGLAVCSRIKDYTALNVRLAFYRAIYIQPLTPEQVGAYLERAGDKLASLRRTLQADEPLRSMAQSPLILNVMSLAYQNTSAEDLSNPALNTNKARRKHLFDTYIARMFNRKASARPYEDEKTKQQLFWLARNMRKHNQEIFLMESLQPSWLSARLWQWIYILGSRLIGVLVLYIPILWVIILILFGSPSLEPWIRWGSALITVGVTIGVIDVLRLEWLYKRAKSKKKSTSLSSGVIYFLMIWLGVILSIRLIFGPGTSILGLAYGPAAGLIFGLRRSQRSPENDIQTVEALPWSWHRAIKGALVGAVIGLIVGLILGIIFIATSFFSVLGPWFYAVLAVLLTGLYFLPIAGLAGAILNGLHREIKETKSSPNQGLQLSIRNAIFGGLITATGLGMIFTLGFGVIRARGTGIDLISGINSEINSGLNLILIFAPIAIFWYGGLDVIQHYILRLILLILGYTPRNYARFLDYAVDRIFLQKVGGGYRFIHRLLLEHFAEMGEAK